MASTPSRDALRDVPVGDYALRCGVDEELLRAAARRVGSAESVSVFEDLGVQQAPNSTLSSYLNKLLWILTGNFAKKGGQHLHSSLAPLFSQVSGRTPVTGAPIIAGLVPSNAVPEEILTDHPDRFRAMIVESANPAHSLADSTACRAAFQALELMVVVDVAMTETARLAHYVLPAASQYEKTEATFFNFEFPHNGFHLRRPLLEPLPGTLPEPEIWARLVRALGVIDEADLRPLREAAETGPPGLCRGVSHRRGGQSDYGEAGSVRALRNARADAARRYVRSGCGVGAGPEDRDDLPRGRAASRPRRRQRAVRRHPEQPVGSHVHRAQLRG